jgi:hypothetical protein
MVEILVSRLDPGFNALNALAEYLEVSVVRSRRVDHVEARAEDTLHRYRRLFNLLPSAMDRILISFDRSERDLMDATRVIAGVFRVVAELGAVAAAVVGLAAPQRWARFAHGVPWWIVSGAAILLSFVNLVLSRPAPNSPRRSRHRRRNG